MRSAHIKNGQVKRPDLGANAVNSSKVADGSLLGRDFAAGQLPRGEKGEQGPQGIQGETGAPGSAKGYMRVNPSDAAPGGVTTAPMTSPPPHSKGVISVVQPDLGATGSNFEDSKFCFNLTFTPEVAATSPHGNNNATIGVTVPSDTGSSEVSDADCPAGHRDAVARTRGANTGNDVNDTIFSIIFE